MAKMTDEDLLALIANYERQSMGSSVTTGTGSSSGSFSNNRMTTLEVDRFDALNMYYGRPLGNEVENRSQVVIPELRDTLEWIMPQLMNIFAASKQICRFDPEGPQDEDQAELETEAVNHVFMSQNDGFNILHDFFKDALLLRNGYAKVYWEKEKKTSVESYTGLTEQELPQVLQKGEGVEIEVLEQREYSVEVAPGQSVPVFDIKVRRTSDSGKVCVKGVPPEEIYVSARTRGSLNDETVFAMHKTNTPRGNLIADGHNKAWVDSLQAGRPNWLDIDAMARNEVLDQMTIDDNTADKAMQEIEVREVTIKVDYDGDGIAELRRVLVAGDKIGDNEEIEESPLASCSPIRMPHRHTGISLYDLLADIQIMKTTLWRQGADNMAIANNSRLGVNWRTVNLDDLLTSRPGGIVRTDGSPSDSIMQINHQSNLMEQVVPAMDYLDKMREMRTGVGADTMGLDMDVLSDVTKGGQLAGMAAAGLKIELIARLLAEGVKDIFIKIHGALIRHQDQPMQFQMAGKWVEVDPTSWRRRTRVSPVVGLGSGNRVQAQQSLALLAQMQEKLAPFGLVGPKQAYESFKAGAEILGYHNPERFAMDPASQEYAQHVQQMQSQPQTPAPQVQAAQIRAQTAQQQMQADAQTNDVKLRADMIRAQGEAVAAQQKAQATLIHTAQQNQAQLAHDAHQAHQDRGMQAVGMLSDQKQANMQLTSDLIKVLGQILAQQLKQNAEADAGELLAKDVKEARSAL
jgi:hypothetical protein